MILSDTISIIYIAHSQSNSLSKFKLLLRELWISRVEEMGKIPLNQNTCPSVLSDGYMV